MAKTRKEIVQDILKNANYYWYDDNDDNVNPLNPEDYDPIVDKIFKANAVELEKLYAEIEESQREIILGLSKTLVPDQALLPEPGYTVAQIIPKAERVFANTENSFQIVGQSDIGEKYEYYFSPLFEHDYPKCELCAILTESTAIQVEGNKAEVVKEISGGKSSASFWLGLDIGEIKKGDVIPFFLGNKIVDEFDKDYHVFHTSKWLVNGETAQELKLQKGVAAFNTKVAKGDKPHLLDVIGVPDSYEKQIFSRFKNSFLSLSMPANLADLKQQSPPSFEKKELVSALDLSKDLCWIKVELSLAIPNDFLLKNTLYPNCIPLVNRNLKTKYVVKSNYDRIILPMPTTDLFLDVHKVQDTNNEDDNTSYRRIDFIYPNSEPGTFMLRGGSRIRRLNREDASRQIFRLLEVIQDEYSTFKEEGVNRLREDFDVIEKAINRIKKHLPDLFREKEKKSSYFCVANFRPQVARLYYKYWETQGELIKHLGDKINLEVTAGDINIANSKSIIPIQRGKGELSADDYINQLKISLVSKGKISTRGDIELFCNSRYGHLLEINSIRKQLMMLEEGKMGSGILVSIKFIKQVSDEEAQFTRIELQNDLNAKSAFFTHIKVGINHE